MNKREPIVGWVKGLMLAIPVLGRQRQGEYHKLEASLGYVVGLYLTKPKQ